MQSSINVVICTDQNYAQHAGVLIASVLDTKRSDKEIFFHVISDDLSLETQANLNSISSRHNAELIFHNVSNEQFNDLPILNHLSKAAYYRLTIPDILPSNVERALYLDVDMIIRADITELWETNLADYYAAAIVDVGIDDLDKQISLRQILNLPSGGLYFNSGLMLINVKKWREEFIGNKVIKYISDNGDKLYFCDQDALNSILFGKWLPLHPKWNVYRQAFRQYYTFKKRKHLPSDIKEAVRNPCIVHFTGATKPWHSGCQMPYVNEYYKYLDVTPWREFKRPKANLQQFWKEYRWKLRRSIIDALS